MKAVHFMPRVRFWEVSLGEIEEFHASLAEELELMPLSLDLLKSSNLIVASRSGGRVIGIGGIRRHWWLPLAYFVVHREHQGRGLGRHLVNRLSHVACERGYRVVMLTVALSNQRAFRLYHAEGYVTVFRTRAKRYMLRRLSINKSK